MVIAAPEPLRAQLPATRLPNKIIDACWRLRPELDRLDDPTQATKAALRSIAQRARVFRDEIKALDRQIHQLLTETAPATLGVFARGPDTTALCWSAWETTPTGSAPKPPSLGSAAPHP